MERTGSGDLAELMAVHDRGRLGRPGARRPDPGQPDLGTAADPPWAVLTVADTGPGIPADELPHVFDRFFRGRTARPAGSGIGLTVVAELAAAHGGTAEAASQPGRGAIFTIRLPAQTAHPRNRFLTGSSQPLPTVKLEDKQEAVKMRNIRMIIAAAAAVPALALGGGIAYASTGGGTSPGTPAPATITAVQTRTQPASQARYDYGQPGRYRINCDDRDHSGQQPGHQARTGTQLTSTQRDGHQGNQGTGQYRGQQPNGSWAQPQRVLRMGLLGSTARPRAAGRPASRAARPHDRKTPPRS